MSGKILIDLSQLSIDCIRGIIFRDKQFPDTDTMRIALVNTLLFHRNKLRTPNDEVVLCLDNKQKRYWRKEFFPYYKQRRAVARAQDKSFDWDSFFRSYDQLKEEFKQFLPFKTLDVPGAEADDLIAILTLSFCPTERVTIVSSDKDFLQLQQFCGDVRQWSSKHKGFISTKSRKYNLFEHVVKGDSGDGIPNIFSDDDVFIDSNKRQKSVFAKDICRWESAEGYARPETFCSSKETLERFYRNRTLIDLTQIPQNVSDKIKAAYFALKPGQGTFDYCVKHKMSSVLTRGDF